MKKLRIILCLFLLVSCNSRKSGPSTASNDTPGTGLDTTAPLPRSVQPVISAETEQVNQVLAEKSG
ncbi:MAG TPA: hypothetical protein PLZ10_08590, partial [Chitinophagaceae bacterium]|nr:hypothetical protein [Chitinophagaceae bacterium]